MITQTYNLDYARNFIFKSFFFISVILSFIGKGWGQTVTIGSGTTETGSTYSGPIDGYYKSFHYQVIYTATELTAAGMTANAVISGLGFSVSGDYGGGNFLGYKIRMAHTSEVNSSVNNTSTLTEVKSSFSYNPTVTTAGAFDMINFTSNFTWNGTSNILIDICSDGPNPYTSPYGSVRTVSSSTANGSRCVRSDSGTSQCAVNTSSINTTKPQIRFSILLAPCSGTPAPGNTLASVNPVSGGSATVLTLQNTTSGSGVTYQWKSSTDNITFNTISGANSATYSVIPTAPTYYVCDVTCSGTTTTSNPLQVNLAYCTPTATSSTYYISNFTTSGGASNINLSSSGAAGGYINNSTNYSCSQYATGIVNISIGSYVGSGTGLSVYIDWNNNFSFNDAGEKVVGTTAYTSLNPWTSSFSVPAGTPLGNYRMRVVNDYNSSTPVSCPSGISGEVEDYTFSVIAQPTCMAPTALTSSSISYQTANIGWAAPTSGTAPSNYEYEIRTSGAAGSGVTGLVSSGTVSTNSANITGLNGGTTYTYYVRSSCGSGDFSFWVSSTFTTLSCASLPTLVAASSITTSSATISWTAAASGTPAGYEYEVRTSGIAGSGASGLFATNTTTAPVVSANITGLSPATTYTIFVRTVCYSGFNSNWTSAVTFNSGCEAPLSLAASATSSAQTFTTISGSFTAASSNPPTGYIVVRSTSATAPSTLAAATTLPTLGSTWNSISGTNVDYIGTSAGTWTSSGLTNSTTYYYYIFSYNNTTCSGGPVYSTTAYSFSQSTQTCPSFSSTIAINGATAVPGTSYPTLTAAIADLQYCGINQPTILELSSGYPSSTLTETFPITLSLINGMSSINTITIREAAGVTGLSLSTSSTSPAIDVNGGQFWVIDGRPGGSGTRDLLISNSGNGSAIKFRNEASNNTIKFVNVSSNVTSTTSGVIFFAGTNGINGNDNNLINYCDINGNATASNIIYSNGTGTGATATANSNNMISNSLIRDQFSNSVATNGILLENGNTDWTITGNSFYQTASRTFTTAATHTAISIAHNTHNGAIITNNIIGGGNSSAGGSAWTINGSVANRFVGISITASTTATSSIQGNTISNFNFSTTSGSTSSGGPWCGILVSAGKVNIGNINGNIIGSSTGVNSIILNLATNSGGISSGIFIAAIASDFNVSNNIIGSITITGTSVSIAHGFNGINTAATGSVSISNNLIGSNTSLNSINISNACTNTTGTLPYLNGIYNTGNSNSLVITNNTISNLNNAFVPSSFQSSLNSIVCGISSSAGTTTISNNTIRNLIAAANSTNTGLKSSVIGISATMNAGSSISQNTIYALKSSCASGTTISVTGIAYSAASTGSNIIDKNVIYNLGNMSSTSGKIQGIYAVAGNSNVQNNMISLGLDESGADITLPVSIYGFYELAGTNNFYHNTVNILGTNVTSNTTIPSTSAFYCYAATASRNVKNNIFVNVRSNASASGGPKNYAVYFPSSGVAGTCDYNIYQASGLGAVFGAIAGGDKASFTLWKAYSTSLDPNSLEALPTFTSTTDLHLNPAANCSLDNKGTYIAAVTTDIDGASRSNSTPDIGADEFTFSGANVTWTGGTSNVVTNTANWAGGILPSTCSNVIIQSGSANYPSYTTLTIDPGTTYTLQSGAQLTISGTLTNNGTLTLESGATLVQGSGSTLAGSGTYNVKQTITGAGSTTPSGRFWYLGSPVSLASSSVYFASNASNVVKKRDEVNNAWTALSSGTPENLVVGQGYYTQAIPSTSTINFTGGLLNNGSISVSGLTRTAGQGYEGFNLVSNPYPSYLNWDNVTRTNVDGTIWYRTHDGAAMVFDTYVAGSGGVGTNLNGTTVSNFIPPMQSFWVRVSSGSTTGGLTLDNTMRSHFTSVSGSVAGLKSTGAEKDLFLRMNLHNSNKKDQLIVYVNDQASNTFDQLDGEKMMQAGYPQFYTKAGDKKIVINGLNNAKKQQALPITMELVSTGVHSFEIEDLEISNGLVWLEDKQEEIIQALEPGTIYEFYSNSGIIADRFVLHFQLLDGATPTNAHNEVGAYATFNGKGANVHAEAAGVVVIKLPASTEGVTDIQIRDAAGKLVYTGSMNNLETSVQLAEANGIYYVTLNSATGVEVKKVFIQQ
ncbi:MAG: hypothetical protein RLZZ65_271 [Bacteroidota bacterium]|jgi:hypothetical protein